MASTLKGIYAPEGTGSFVQNDITGDRHSGRSGAETRNPDHGGKFEIRSTKYETKYNDENTNVQNRTTKQFRNLVILILGLFRVPIFEFRTLTTWIPHQVRNDGKKGCHCERSEAIHLTQWRLPRLPPATSQ